MIDVMGLAGDSADNIPGVPGIGPKTALALIKTFGSVQQLYAQIDTITKKKQHANLVQHKEQAYLSKDLVTIDTKVPLSFDPETFFYKAPDNTRLAELFKNLEFRQLQHALAKQTDLSQKQYQAVLDIDMLIDLVTLLESVDILSVDTETPRSLSSRMC